MPSPSVTLTRKPTFGEQATALCTNFKCKDAQWTERGYYEVPRIIEKTIDSFYKECGGQLTYPCEGCGRPFGGDQYCGSCGKKHYEVPTCKTCDSWLMEEDMNTDTAEKGCQKCRAKMLPRPGTLNLYLRCHPTMTSRSEE